MTARPPRQAGILTISNNLDGANLTLTGSASLAGKDAGTQAILIRLRHAARVQSATGNTGTTASTTSA